MHDDRSSFKPLDPGRVNAVDPVNGQKSPSPVRPTCVQLHLCARVSSTFSNLRKSIGLVR